MKVTITDDLPKQMLRWKMRRIEKIIQVLDSEELLYLVNYAITEMDRRSLELAKGASNGK